MADAAIQVELVWADEAGHAQSLELALPAGSTIDAALQQAVKEPGSPVPQGLPAGVWGRRMPGQTPLADGDRLELYRPLKVDPKRARRERFARQGARATGLFAKRRPEAKSGY
ncbi:hypothetical protein GCM10027082_25200 [Comamonas humi]